MIADVQVPMTDCAFPSIVRQPCGSARSVEHHRRNLQVIVTGDDGIDRLWDTESLRHSQNAHFPREDPRKVNGHLSQSRFRRQQRAKSDRNLHQALEVRVFDCGFVSSACFVRLHQGLAVVTDWLLGPTSEQCSRRDDRHTAASHTRTSESRMTRQKLRRRTQNYATEVGS